MPDFDILGPNAYGAQPAQGAPSDGFDILGNAYNRPLVGPNGQPLPAGAVGAQPQAQQPQGAPVSGLLAGVLGLPRYSGAVPGAVYTTPGQAPVQPGQIQAQQAGQPQAPGIAPSLGTGLNTLYDRIVGGSA